MTETYSLGLPFTSLLLDIHVTINDTCQHKVSADQYQVTISRAQVRSSSRSRYCSWARTHDHDDDDDGVAQDRGHTPSNRLTETYSLGLPFTSLLLDIHVTINDTCQHKVSADQYHVTISRAQVRSSSRSRVF